MTETKTTKRDGEYRVRLFIDNEYQAGADYFTDCRQDADLTAKAMIANGVQSDKSSACAIAEQTEYESETAPKLKRFFASCSECETTIAVSADVDLDSTFRAFDEDVCEWVRINGWLWTFEELEAGA